MSITNLNGSVQQATPIAIQMRDGSWTAFEGGIAPVTATISSGTSLSGVIDLGIDTAMAIVMPAAWTAAAVTFQVSLDNVTWSNLKNKSDDSEYTCTVSQGNSYTLPFTDFVPYRYIKIRSGTAATPVNQAADRIVTIAARNV